MFLFLFCFGTCGAIMIAVSTGTTISCSLGRQYRPMLGLSFLFVYAIILDVYASSLNGATTLNTMTCGITTLTIFGKIVTLVSYAERHYPKCCYIGIVLSIIRLGIILLGDMNKSSSIVHSEAKQPILLKSTDQYQ